MASASKLTLAFINKRPQSAAQILASLPAADAAAFVNSLPTRYAVKVFLSLSASNTASIIQLMDLTAARAAIRDMEFAAASAVLRQLAPPVRAAYLADLPHQQQREFEASLAFAPDTVGAKMTTFVAALTETDSVKSALSLLKDDPQRRSEIVYVLDSDRKFVGAVRLLTLLQHPPKTALAELLDDACVSISPHAGLEQIAELDAWHEFSQLPVVSRRGEVIGTLFRTTFSQPEVIDTSSADANAVATPLLFAMADCMRGLLDLLMPPSSLTPRAGRIE
ncbi:MAG: hypothetical protein WBN23_04625 [Woeseia sp.]